MYNSQKIAERIKKTAQNKGYKLGAVLSECGLGINTVAKISKGNDILTLNFAKIADYLECSVDYLLGRKEYNEYNNKTYSDTENKLIEFFRDLNEEGQEYVIKQFQFALSQSEYKKHNQNEIQKHA